MLYCIETVKYEALDGSQRSSKLDEIKHNACLCKRCELHRTRTNCVFSDGKVNAKIMLIGEAPGADEDACGTPFVGRAGKYLNELLKQSGIDRGKDIYICNTVKCRPENNRAPKPDEKKECSKYLSAQISIVNPKVIVICGACAMEAILGKGYKITQTRGQWFEIFGGIRAMVILHPSYLLRKHSETEDSPRGLTRGDWNNIKTESEKLA